jgi:NADH-ubiquinone oxidoreductase chain 2
MWFMCVYNICVRVAFIWYLKALNRKKVMIFTSILILIVAIALPSFKKDISSILITRISAIIFIYSGALSLNAFYIQSIGSGIGIYSGLFHVTIISQLLDVLLFFLSAFILMS